MCSLALCLPQEDHGDLPAGEVVATECVMRAGGPERDPGYRGPAWLPGLAAHWSHWVLDGAVFRVPVSRQNWGPWSLKRSWVSEVQPGLRTTVISTLGAAHSVAEDVGSGVGWPGLAPWPPPTTCGRDWPHNFPVPCLNGIVAIPISWDWKNSASEFTERA